MNERTIAYKQEEHSPHLIIISGDVRTYTLDGEQTLGRPTRTHTPALPVPSGVASRRHGIFKTDASGCRFTDTGSLNGTILNGQRLTPGQAKLLSDGDILRIHGDEDANSEMDTILIYSTAAEKKRIWRRITLTDLIEVGMGRDKTLRLSSNSVSRHHASLFHAKKGWVLLDHSSLNGVYLNAVRLEKPTYLFKHDVIRIADYYFVFREEELLCQIDIPSETAAGEENATAELQAGSRTVHRAEGQDGNREEVQEECPTESWDESPEDFALSIWIEERNVWQRTRKKTLLRDIRVDIPNGSMVLILGGSGAGKTTFMNAVMGYERAEGKILYKETDIYREYEQMKYQIGYVPQEDLLRMNDTVYDTLYNAANMRLPVMSEDEYAAHVDETLHLLGLERLRDSLVGKLSGGQRKRLSIAVEYIGNPALFFLDEPDSGLDGIMARQLWENLRTIADQGKIVMVISHSPDRAFRMFDKVIVLAKSSEEVGRLVFFGTPEHACGFFEVKTLEEIMQRINYREEGGEGLADEYIRRFEKGEY